ncbi:MAG: ammonium transporter, partial [Leptospiraceae bacterium]|nr:ammonium transporter [Leptospiraceae bacterium]
SIPFAILGCFVLLIGWYGFNPGSWLGADPVIGKIAVNTTLAGVAGAFVAMMVTWFKDGKPDVAMTGNGLLAGLVGVTAGCWVVEPVGALIIGLLAGALVVFAVSFFDKIKIDDPVGAVSVHLVCGIWGTLCVGIFGGGTFMAQLIGVLAAGAFCFPAALILFLALKFTTGIRVSEEEELKGLDLGEHGQEAYAGFQIIHTK